ncbi:molybdopterin-guanine dinucleotide biosynthesis protein B [Clostridium cochlearium]|uniref:molybdopterin-guanine dinucleotide biosynthesis protein B n=1 Tax=Clostridium cochlearium TaxID=1494 RepID=UPI00180647C6|nr:molybdopterin-guanine dinucleotide biosynthesis protein B [Clostridium cochlearium]NMA58229.1 molybdopterin-guanine dinucleotide biosynthesis protein B [Clostridium cochlearium]
MKKQKIIAISGVKNSGKTTLITRLIPHLKDRGIKIAVIKHDGHDFEPDVIGTDSYRYREAGAEEIAIFSKNKWMIIKEEKNIDESELISQFPNADLILLEGFKFSDYPKVEIIRKEVSSMPITNPKTVIAYVSDHEKFNGKIKQFHLDDIEGLTDYLYNYIKDEQ